MSIRHHADLILCRKQPGIAIGKLCKNCDGKCVICDSTVRPQTKVHICEECNYGSLQGKCIICGGKGVSDAYYCKSCVLQEKDRDGCPRVINVSQARTDLHFEKKKYVQGSNL
ncbi:predicted protein [Naegleria gruberi]|uniref:Predicted protein n=1 Tax=Naegleria gruberi TaxID=5762 RepID=D2UXU9_NAEGR|nr:uncharacterized protein NAEGRDRAFT_60125 [Naegleria gruberi]EFC50351.1 predicted protein [Naegleria gruberi]|eukprot:XP_002683095.1 predicted protein [Naegleria gruberi strain NEG-M]